METVQNTRKISDLKIRSKIMIGFSITLMALMVATTVTIAFMIFRQNREASFSLLEHGMTIIQEDMQNVARNLSNEAKLVTTHEDIVSNLESQLVNVSSETSDAEIEYMDKELAQYLFEQVQKTTINKAVIYTTNGELVLYVDSSDNGTEIVFPHKGQYQIARINPGDSLEFKSWKIVGNVEGIESIQAVYKPVGKNQVTFHVSDGLMFYLSTSNVVINKYNESTAEDEPVAIANLYAYQLIGDSKVGQLSRLVGADVNFFVGNQFSTGTLTDYAVLQSGEFDQSRQNWVLTEQKAEFEEVELKGRSFFQAVIPVYGDGSILGHLAALFEADIAMKNTWQIIKVLCIIAVVGIVVFLPVIFFLSTKISRPLEAMASAIDETKNTGNFSNRVDVENQDEIGITGLAYNELMETLQTAIAGINDVMETVSEGDLSNTVDGNFKGDVEKLQSSINRALEMLGNTVVQVMGVSEHVHSSSVELNTAAQNLANGSSQQAASLEEISSSMVEVRQSANQNMDYAENALDLTNNTIETVGAGNEKMDGMLHSMNKIHGTSLEVSKVIKVIDEIAFQTNLLALNAAVEAARAGKYGKGFAVVADEVRNLASRSAEAARNTNELIDNAARQVESGVNEANDTADALEEITESVNEVKSLIDKIAEASKAQQSGTEEINKGLDQINNVVQQNSAISEETSSSASVLSSHAEQLNILMQRFQVKGKGVEIIEDQLTGQEEDPVYELETDQDPLLTGSESIPKLGFDDE
ncbi:MAG: methyl-accepting chemotaxis protein [Proteobacteria bacterium]|nr:methyl-accepting chemotaxis protein [Pseudomonadota bacterium]